MAEEGSTRTSLASRLKGHLKEAPFFCKIIELILCIIATGLIVSPFNKIPQEDMSHAAIFYTAVCGFIVINIVLIIGYLLGEKMPKKTALMFSGLGAALCCIAGLILIRDWTSFPNNMISRYVEQYSDQMATAGFFAVLAALVFALDTYFINRYE